MKYWSQFMFSWNLAKLSNNLKFLCMKRVQIWKYGAILCISPYSVWMQENTDQKKLLIWILFMHTSIILFTNTPFIERHQKNVWRLHRWGKGCFYLNVILTFRNGMSNCESPLQIANVIPIWRNMKTRKVIGKLDGKLTWL